MKINSIFNKQKKRAYTFSFALVLSIYALAQTTPTPDKLWGDLFVQVQTKHIFADNKTFVDAVPKYEPSKILVEFSKHKADTSFDLKKFVEDNFNVPGKPNVQVKEGLSLIDHLNDLWDVLTRKADTKQPYSTLLPLPESYIVPGGRFREVYYWDSYFTIQGLAESDRYGMIENMLDNFKYLIDHYGHIPNGNRNYYLSRSQPPFFALMVDLLYEHNGDSVYHKYYTAMEKEYRYWMEGENKVGANEGLFHLVKMPDGSILNRYCDRKDAPREESYAQDLETAKQYKNNDGKAYINLRSGAESGYDFSSRWFGDTLHLNTIETTDLVPVDLNSLLYAYEIILSKAAKANGETAKGNDYLLRAAKRKKAILKYCWNDDLHFFFDYNIKQGHTTNRWCISGDMPLFVNIATNEQAEQMQKVMSEKFLKDGGFVTTIYHTGQQWDAPNGWAPLQWIAVKGLMNYHYDSLARLAAERWMAVNERVFKSTGKMLEKYNVEDIHLESGGGEYPTQDGFGWSNGIYLKFYDMFRSNKSKYKTF